MADTTGTTSTSTTKRVGATQMVSVRYGPLQQLMPVVGKTVAEVRNMVQESMSVPGDAKGKNGKTDLADDHVITEDDELTFHRKMGEKG